MEAHSTKASSPEPETPVEELPPGIYRVDEDGNVNQALDWQKAIERVQWERVHEVIENLFRRGSGERKLNLLGMYLLAGVTIVAAAWLAAVGIIEGQAIAGFLGASIGYLLSRASVRG